MSWLPPWSSGSQSGFLDQQASPGNLAGHANSWAPPLSSYMRNSGEGLVFKQARPPGDSHAY